MPDTSPEHQHQSTDGVKCYECGAPMGATSSDSPYAAPAVSATSFAEFDALRAASAQESAAMTEMSVFNVITMNINASPTLSPIEKANAIAAAAAELPARIARAAGSPEEAEEDRMAAGIAELATTTDPGSLMVFKDLNGDWRWSAIHTNRYEDRQREIFPESAHKAFIDQAWATKQFPSLRIWHIPHDIGRADFLDYDDNGFVVSSGKFFPEYLGVAEKLAGMKDLGCSHGFLYRREDLQNGVYKAYRTYEVSVLPRMKAANTLTAFFATEEVPDMALTADRKDFFENLVGKDVVERVESGLRSLKQIAEERGISYKSLEDELLTGMRDDGGAGGGMSHGPGGNLSAPGPGDPSKDDDEAEKKPKDEKAEGDKAAAADEEPKDGGGTPTAANGTEKTEDTEDMSDEGEKPTKKEEADAEKAIPATAASPYVTDLMQHMGRKATDEAKTEAESVDDDAQKPDDAEAGKSADAQREPPAATAPTPSAAEQAAAAQSAAAAAEPEGMKALAALLAPLLAREVAPLNAQIKSMEDEITALKATKDAELANAIRPRVGPDSRINGAKSQSQSDDNIVDGSRLAAAAKADPTEGMASSTKAAHPYVQDMVGRMGRQIVTMASGVPTP